MKFLATPLVSMRVLTDFVRLSALRHVTYARFVTAVCPHSPCVRPSVCRTLLFADTAVGSLVSLASRRVSSACFVAAWMDVCHQRCTQGGRWYVCMCVCVQ